MRSIEDKGCLNYGRAQELSGSSGLSFEFHKGQAANRASHRQTALGKPTPLKWDDAQKWLGNHLSSRGGEKNQSKPRNSNADDRRLITPVPKEEYPSSEDEGGNDIAIHGAENNVQYEGETKKMDCDESVWRINKHSSSTGSAVPVVRSICVRDMGTEMTPVASQEPSRTATPLKATTPATRSPVASGSSTPTRYQNGQNQVNIGASTDQQRGESSRGNGSTSRFSREREEIDVPNVNEYRSSDQPNKPNPLETRAMAWDEAERAKYLARYKREEVKIQAWENHQKRKAEMSMRRMEVKADQMKSRAEEKYANKLAATKRIAEEKRANAESKLNEKALKTSEKADYIRRTGHMPSSFSLKLPSFCW